MKVGNKVSSQLQGLEGAKATKAGQKEATEKSKFSATDLGGTAKVNMSDRAQAMQKAKDIAKADTVDEAKVARLQKLIDEGKYSVDARAVADRLVDEQMNMPE